jgi:hypothetical protein
MDNRLPGGAMRFERGTEFLDAENLLCSGFHDN